MQRETIHAEILDGERWAEVDDPNDLRVANSFNRRHALRFSTALPAVTGATTFRLRFIRNILPERVDAVGDA
jgi:hypothetical protein